MTPTGIRGILLVICGVCAVCSEDALYFTNQRLRQVLKMSLEGGNHTSLRSNSLINPIAVAYDETTDTIFFTERSSNLLTQPKYVASYSPSSGTTFRHDFTWHSVPDGLALDPISRLLFYTDAGEAEIGVLPLDLRYRKAIIREALGNPRGITLDPVEGMIYWTDWGDGIEHIGRARMDGSNRENIVTTGLGWPNGITLDMTGPVKYLYWCDAKLNHMKRSNTDGTDIRIIFSKNSHFYDLVVDETYIYYTDWTKGAIQKIDKRSAQVSTDVGTVYPLAMSRYHGLAIDKASIRLSGINACSSTWNGGCAHLCLPTNHDTRVCHCNEGFTLNADNKGCEKLKLQNVLVVSDKTRKGIFALDLDKGVAKRLPMKLFGYHTPMGIVYDETTDQYFWVDSGTRIVATGCLHKECTKVLNVQRVPSSPVGIAIDNDRYMLYVVDNGLRNIIRMDYKGGNKTVLINSRLHKPLSIALDTSEGFMYWTDWGRPARIERARMENGNDREDFVFTALDRPKGITIDQRRRLLFWTDESLGRIEMIALDGSGRRVVYDGRGAKFTSLVYGSGKLYYAIVGFSSIHSFDLVTKSTETYGNGLFLNVTGLVYNSLDPFNGSNTKMTSQSSKSSSDKSLIISIAVSVGGIVIIIAIILTGVLCYKYMGVRRAPAPTVTELATVQAAVQGSQGQPKDPIYSEVPPDGYHARLPAPPPTAPPTHPYFGPIPDVLAERGPTAMSPSDQRYLRLINETRDGRINQ